MPERIDQRSLKGDFPDKGDRAKIYVEWKGRIVGVSQKIDVAAKGTLTLWERIKNTVSSLFGRKLWVPVQLSTVKEPVFINTRSLEKRTKEKVARNQITPLNMKELGSDAVTNAQKVADYISKLPFDKGVTQASPKGAVDEDPTHTPRATGGVRLGVNEEQETARRKKAAAEQRSAQRQRAQEGSAFSERSPLMEPLLPRSASPTEDPRGHGITASDLLGGLDGGVIATIQTDLIQYAGRTDLDVGLYWKATLIRMLNLSENVSEKDLQQVYKAKRKDLKNYLEQPAYESAYNLLNSVSEALQACFINTNVKKLLNKIDDFELMSLSYDKTSVDELKRILCKICKLPKGTSDDQLRSSARKFLKTIHSDKAVFQEGQAEALTILKEAIDRAFSREG